mgnify:CR=1 FL=1
MITTTTMSSVSVPAACAAPLRRVAIIGTAPSWRACPFDDATLEIWGLNDGYATGMPRANAWYDIHPPYQWVLRNALMRNSSGGVSPDQLPVGAYVRPEGHLEWLRTRPFPVHLFQAPPTWPQAQTFPFASLCEAVKDIWPKRFTRHRGILAGKPYLVSTPNWMLLHAIVQGIQEIHVYGIELKTEWEYLRQRPAFEWLLGYAAGRGIQIVLPEATPICREAFVYGLELKADIAILQAQRQAEALKQEGAVRQRRIAALPPWRRLQRQEEQARLHYLDIELADQRDVMTRAQAQLNQ